MFPFDTVDTVMAYGVDPTRHERFSLRQARYEEIGHTIANFLAQQPDGAPPIKVMDAGVGNGVSILYIEKHCGLERVELHGVDISPKPCIYKRSEWASIQPADLLDGLPGVASDQYDVVICEQVLEHLPSTELAIATLTRILKPNGLLIVGVPIFVPGADWVRSRLVPLWDQIVRRQKPRGHLQAFSLRSFAAALRRQPTLTIKTARGFRVVSGGFLRRLENYRWWWRANRSFGAWLPAICTEVQIVAVKSLADPPNS